MHPVSGSLGVQCFTVAPKSPVGSKVSVQAGSTSNIHFGSKLRDQELLGWVDCIEAKLRKGPLCVTEVSSGVSKAGAPIYNFTFQFCGEDDAYTLSAQLSSNDNIPRIFSIMLLKQSDSPESQRWPGIKTFTNFPNWTLWFDTESGKHNDNKSLTVFINSSSKAQSQTISYSRSVYTQVLNLQERLIRLLQKAQTYSPKEAAAMEYNRLQARFALVQEDFSLGYEPESVLDEAMDRHKNELDDWKKSLIPIARLERKSVQEMQQEIEKIAEKQVRDCSGGSGKRLWQRCLAYLGKPYQTILFEPIATITPKST